MKKEDIKFEIDQLRKDKMIYALESIALTFIIEVTYFLMTIIAGQSFTKSIALFFLLVPLGYYIYMVAGNLSRLNKIKKLEKKLS